MVDESSQMWLGELLPILEQNKKLKRLVMVGDHKQLPPYGSQQMDEAKLDCISLFEHCVQEKYERGN
jgi:superfamily I DNA and/or RNA helicase